MNKSNLIIAVSSHNNYDMLDKEVLNNINLEDFEFINIDDNSTSEEITKGVRLCEYNEIEFIHNKGKGVQFAVNTLMKFVTENRPDCKWILLFQHDNYPITPNFFERISKLIENGIPDEIAVLGFNNLDHGDYTGNALETYKTGEFAPGLMGKMHLQIKGTTNRWVAPLKNTIVKTSPELFKTPFSVEIPLEASIAINIDKWQEVIQPTDEYEFHLWFPDVMMQFLYNNLHCVILPELYCMNDQSLKEKYGFHKSSAHGARNGQEHIYGKYGPHLVAWKDRWGWDYENTSNFPTDPYKNTLIGDFWNHNFMETKQHLFTYDLKY